MVAPRLYLLEMNSPMYQVDRLRSVPVSNIEFAKAADMVSGATQAQLLISVIYFLVWMALLVVPLLLAGPLRPVLVKRAQSSRGAMGTCRYRRRCNPGLQQEGIDLA